MVALRQPAGFEQLPEEHPGRSRGLVTHVKSAIELASTMEFEAALNEIEAAHRLAPSDPVILNNYGAILAGLERPGEALEKLSESLAIRPDNATTLRNRSVVFADLDRYEEALADAEKALELWPDYIDAKRMRVVALLGLERYDEASLAIRTVPILDDEGAFAGIRRVLVLHFLNKEMGEGKASWSGRKPKGSNPPIEITPGPPISDYVHQDRR